MYTIFGLKLSMIINCKVDTVTICRLLQNLNDDNKLMLCLNTTNPFVQFECIRQVSSKNNQSLDQTNMMTQCLVKLSQEPNFWHQFLSYFNINPSRYPSLQKPLGKALAQMEEDKLREYVAVMKINELHISRRQISECLTAFCEEASKDKKTFLFGEIFQEWNGFIEKSLKCCLTRDKEFSLNVSANEIFYTDFIGVVVAHISTFRQTKISEEIETLINKLNSVRTEKWFESEVLQERFFHVLLSKLFVHSLAWKKKGCNFEGQDRLYASLKIFTDNKYLFHLYRVNKETLKLIGVMRKNFSL